MNDLVQQLKDKAGLTDEQAMKAIETLKEYIYGKVPPMFSGFLDTFFAGGDAAAAQDDDVLLH